MPHILLAPPVTAASFGMREAASPAALVAAAGRPQRGPASVVGTVAGAIALTPIAPAADDDLHPAPVAEEHSPRRLHWRFPSRQRDIHRDLRDVDDSLCTRARHTVGHGIGVDLAVLAGVVLVPLGGSSFTAS